MKKIFYILILLLVSKVNAQEIKQGTYNFDIFQTIDNTDYFYYFNKGKNDTFINLKIMSFNLDSIPKNTLCNEVKYLDSFYHIAEQHIKVDLYNMNVGNPLVYKDVLTKQINYFANDTSWQNYFAKYKKLQKSKNSQFVALDYSLIAQKMLDGKIYDCLDEKLRSIGYYIKQIGIEKVTDLNLNYQPENLKEDLLKQLPYKEALYKTIPIPLIVYVGVDKL
ncbi:MAG: hypothetical protein H6553_04830 [Chitinophagales bacterium]|nr:hypothetical protein [Chitinophagales bacterium]